MAFYQRYGFRVTSIDHDFFVKNYPEPIFENGIQLFDMSLILYAEHGGGNNSSFTTHVISSSGTDTYAAIAAAVGSLKGPKHGGVNIAD